MVAISWSDRCAVVVVKPSALRSRSFRLLQAPIAPWMLPHALLGHQARVLPVLHLASWYTAVCGSSGSHLGSLAALLVALLLWLHEQAAIAVRTVANVVSHAQIAQLVSFLCPPGHPFFLNLNQIIVEHQGLNVGSFRIIRGFLGAQIMILR